MRAVVLAAGDGGRLGAHTTGTPKPLVSLAGRPIIAYTLEALAEAGVSEAVIVTGYHEAQVRAALEDHPLPIRFVTNPRYHEGAALSLRAAREACGGDPFLLVMADHVLSAGIIATLIAAEERGHSSLPPPPSSLPSYVAADFHPREAAYAEEATKLAVAVDGRVTAIGKHLERWDALDAGAFACSPAAWDALDALPEDSELSPVFAALAAKGALLATDISGQFWYDIDTPDDLATAESLVAAAAR